MHEQLWQQFLQSHQKNRLNHALLLIGTPRLELETLSRRMSAMLLCKAANAPCGQCQSCRLIDKQEHPDWQQISPEKESSVIKIDQIRRLQTMIHLSAQLGGARVIVISPAEKLNNAAANALLKMLEEPTENTFFLLIAEHISTLPATILSRCQQWRCSSTEHLTADYLTQLAHYPPESERGRLLKSAGDLVAQMEDLCAFRQDVHTIAASWSKYPFADLVWVLYVINAQLIQIKLGTASSHSATCARMPALADKIALFRLFGQLDTLHDIIRKLNHAFSMNQLLVLETLLLGYVQND